MAERQHRPASSRYQADNLGTDWLFHSSDSVGTTMVGGKSRFAH